MNDNENFGLLGRTLGHSFSPQIHKALGGYDYSLFEKEPEEVGEFIRNGDYKGINVTIPYKRTVMEFCDEISEVAAASNSVNTIVKDKNGKIRGDNTDYYGFRYLLESDGLSPEGQKTLIFGTGGVSGTIRKALQDMGASEIVMISRKGENNYSNLDRHYDAGFLVNATPVGMFPNSDASVTDVRNFPDCKGVADVVYNPLRTKFVLQARDAGIPAVTGLKMLVAQAAAACGLFRGIQVPAESIEEQTAVIRRQQESISLIGMPGCGKTSVGNLLAEATGKKLIDTDDLILEITGRTPEEIIRGDGEKPFRQIETQALSKALHSGGYVIATGGGTVETDSNRYILMQNSRIVYLKRDLDKLPSNNRPVSQRDGVAGIYERRKDRYESWSDYEADNNGAIENTVNTILKKLGYN